MCTFRNPKEPYTEFKSLIAERMKDWGGGSSSLTGSNTQKATEKI